jgi:hypothetical protein
LIGRRGSFGGHCSYGGATPQPHRGNECVCDHLSSGLGVQHRQAGAPLEIPDEGSPELGIRWEAAVVRRSRHERCEPKSVFRCDAEVAMVIEHRLIAPMLIGVDTWAAEHLRPPVDDVLTEGFEQARSLGSGGWLSVCG